jgi:leader peptidase (prepilin peptidase)/N-methyltransferase
MVGALWVWAWRIAGTLAFGRVAMGLGDVHLMLGVGAVVGAGASTVAFYVSPFFGILIALYFMITRTRRELPFGPYLSLGTAFVMLAYCPIAAYLTPGLQGIKALLTGQ